MERQTDEQTNEQISTMLESFENLSVSKSKEKKCIWTFTMNK